MPRLRQPKPCLPIYYAAILRQTPQDKLGKVTAQDLADILDESAEEFEELAIHRITLKWGSGELSRRVVAQKAEEVCLTRLPLKPPRK